jgi:hypothetical protein
MRAGTVVSKKENRLVGALKDNKRGDNVYQGVVITPVADGRTLVWWETVQYAGHSHSNSADLLSLEYDTDLNIEVSFEENLG